MQGDDIGLLQQRMEVGGLVRIAQRQLGDHIMEHHLHAQAFGQHRQLRANGAVADDAQGLATDLEGVVSAFLPAAPVRYRVLLGDATQQQDGFGQHQLSDGAGVGERRVEDRNTALARRIQIDLVGANAKATHGDQLVGRGKYIGCQLRAGADADKVHVGDLALELLALQGAGQRLDLGITRRLQHLERGRVDALEQQELDLRFIQRCFGHECALSLSQTTAVCPHGCDRQLADPGRSWRRTFAITCCRVDPRSYAAQPAPPAACPSLPPCTAEALDLLGFSAPGWFADKRRASTLACKG